MAEIALEKLALALEGVRGTAVTPPTHLLNMTGTLTPQQETYKPADQLGTLAEFYRGEIVRKWSEIEAEGDLDVSKLPLLLNMVMGVVTAPTTPTNAVLTRLWTFIRNITSDTIKSATWCWGDPNQRMWQAAYGMIEELVISSEASGTEATKISLTGTCQAAVDLAAPSLPSLSLGPLLVPGKMQMWLDTTSPIGTTPITGRLLSAEHTIPTGVTYKYPATGPAGTITYSRTGRNKVHATTTVVIDLVDQAQWDLYENGDLVKLRVRHNGPLIESVSPDYYYYVEVDTYGIFEGFSWGDYEGNRTMEVTVEGQYNSALGSDLRIAVQNANTSL